MATDYAWQKAIEAVDSLATDGQFPDRLAYAYLYLKDIRREHLPDDELWRRLQDIMAKFPTVEPEGDEGGALASARKMETEEATAVAKLIVSLSDEITAKYRDW